MQSAQQPLFEDSVEPSPVVAQPSEAKGSPRLRKAERLQGKMFTESLDQRLDADHTARTVWDFVMNTNAKGAYFVAQQVGKVMIAKKTQGRIINVASLAGMRALSQLSVYSMSKAAVIHMTRAMALEWGRYGINVNAICPGYIETEINAAHFQTEAGQKLVNLLPRRRVGKPEDLDALLMMLASDASGFINGAAIAADDGMSAG